MIRGAVTGCFVTFEGGEGAGKTTQIARLAERLGEAGHTVTVTREPGGSPGAERIRSLLLDRAQNSFSAGAEALLFAAARRDHVDQTVRPALAAGHVVLCDRFFDSTAAYQGAVGAVRRKTIAALRTIASDGLEPALTVVLDLDPAIGLGRALERRARGAAPDRFEAETIDFHQRIRAAFLSIAAAEPERCVVVDADRPEDRVAEDIWQVVDARLFRPVAGAG